MAAEGTSRIKHCTGNGWEPLAHLHVLASRWSERTCKSPQSSNVPSRPQHREELLVLAFVRYPPPADLRGLPFANVRTAVHVQHLPSDVRSLGQINHGIHNLLNGRNASHWG